MKFKKIASLLTTAALAFSMTACSANKTEEASTQPNQAGIVGSWQLSKVLVSETEGENPVEVKEEDHASMFEEKENVYTFNEDGTGTMVIVDGADEAEIPLTWTTNENGEYTVAAEDIQETYIYDPVDNVLMREYIGNDPYIHVVTVFARK